MGEYSDPELKSDNQCYLSVSLVAVTLIALSPSPHNHSLYWSFEWPATSATIQFHKVRKKLHGISFHHKDNLQHTAGLIVSTWRLSEQVSRVAWACCQWAELCGDGDRSIQLHNSSWLQQVSNSVRLVVCKPPPVPQRRKCCETLLVHAADICC